MDPDAQLLARVAAGDREQAVTALYRRHGGAVLGYGRRLLGDASLAEELVQETFVRLWQSAPRYDPGRGSVRTYTFAIAHHVGVDFLRRASVRPKLAPGDVMQDGPAVADPTEQLVHAHVVREALDALAPKHREVLELSFDEDLPDKDIAERLGIPTGTVKSRTYYALRALRAELEERDALD